ncbi:lantibiotic dehydratase [Streptomyces pactum]|uniref:Lantibiotic dehydratase n=1 Tax=Streptomyces pactum TaxID=68249 RepID=A0A1S6JJE0_9ACTN|nr:lantibiotic dehydratase [Streptomyces pactum]AQS71884.1 lantibiotic dehydratase [Streptomyces pactum]
MAWLRTVLADYDLAEALEYASPVLAARVRSVCTSVEPSTARVAPSTARVEPSARQVGRVALSVARYLLRSRHRATPFGLFAGVTVAGFGPQARASWGGEHVAVGHAGAEWLAAVVERLESCPGLFERLPVVVNNTVTSRGDRFVVPFQSDDRSERTRAVEASLALTEPVRAVLAVAREPVRGGELVDKLQAEFPEAGPEKVRRLLAELVRRRVLITGLHAPSTETDALGHLLDRLRTIDAADLPALAETARELGETRAMLTECASRGGRDSAAARMRALVPGLRRHPVALDLRLDAQLVLPDAVARETERAALILTRLSGRPYGTAAWGAYHQRFYERYGIGTMVPLQEVVADSGIGYPEGYPGTSPGARRPRLSARDDALVRLAQAAALDGSDEVVLTDESIDGLDAGPDEPRLPPHLEMGVRVHAGSVDALQRGRFRLEIVSVSRGVGVTTGRFLGVLAPADRAALAAELSGLPTADGDTVPAQLSFPPLLPESAHVARAPRVLPTVISLQEHRALADDVLGPADLAVGCDGRRMYLALPERGRRVEAVGMHALNLHTHTPPLVRFLAELPRAQSAQVTVFDWGAAAAMPFLPRLRYGRIVLVPARWRLEASELPGRAHPRTEWDAALTDWRARRRLPRRVHLVEDDRRLFLDLDEAGHRTLLRHHLDRVRQALLEEAAEPGAFGWCDGRAHEVVVPLKATRPSSWPELPAPTPARALSHAQTQTPATSPVLLAALYGDPRRQDALLSRHLPDLLERLGGPPWWFIRFRDPEQHVRLRIALPTPEAFAGTARTVSTWADELRGAGLLADLRYPTSYRETGRWGSGDAWDAAEDVFRADSRAVLAQLSQRRRPHRRTLVAANAVSITSAFLGGTEAGTRWLIDHVPPVAPGPVPRPQFTEAVRLADPGDDWSALRAVPGGAAVVSAWADRDAALAAYRRHLPGPHTQGIALDDVLTSLLHVHFVRHIAVNFPEEEICLHLARAAALAWSARTTGRTPTGRTP